MGPMGQMKEEKKKIKMSEQYWKQTNKVRAKALPQVRIPLASLDSATTHACF